MRTVQSCCECNSRTRFSEAKHKMHIQRNFAGAGVTRRRKGFTSNVAGRCRGLPVGGFPGRSIYARVAHGAGRGCSGSVSSASGSRRTSGRSGKSCALDARKGQPSLDATIRRAIVNLSNPGNHLPMVDLSGCKSAPSFDDALWHFPCYLLSIPNKCRSRNPIVISSGEKEGDMGFPG